MNDHLLLNLKCGLNYPWNRTLSLSLHRYMLSSPRSSSKQPTSQPADQRLASPPLIGLLCLHYQVKMLTLNTTNTISPPNFTSQLHNNPPFKKHLNQSRSQTQFYGEQRHANEVAVWTGWWLSAMLGFLVRTNMKDMLNMHDVYAGEGCCAHRMCVC